MFSKCANPECSVSFEYRLGGKFFRFHQNAKAPGTQRNTHEVVHFWLCGSCADKFALDYDGNRCFLVESLSPRIARKNSAVTWFESADSEEPRQAHAELASAGQGAQRAGGEGGRR